MLRRRTILKRATSSAVRGERVRWQDITLAERSTIDAVLTLRGWNEALIVEFWKDVAREMAKP